ncbi:MAG: SufE family protein [Gammaproteobacteria bacterium TMED243]|nr:Fe-S cluster assembly protein SufE [Gammaproteobacteria bacterium]RPG29903.1 MAG: SufE family protein [Gammaproteobacteria bacterium TMED243]
MRVTLDELLDTFEFFDDWEDKYRFIIDLGKELPGLPDVDKTEDHLIRGCQSQVWLTYESTDEQLRFNMDSDAHIVRGLIAVVLIAIQNRSAADIQRLDIEEIFSQLDLLAHLSVTRGNGLRAMVSRVKEVARGYAT